MHNGDGMQREIVPGIPHSELRTSEYHEVIPVDDLVIILMAQN